MSERAIRNMRRGYASLIREALGLVFVAVATAPAFSTSASAQPAPRVATLSPAETLALAEQLVTAGEFDQAKAVLQALEQSASPRVDQVQVQFLLGMIALGESDYLRARDVFRRILETRPDLPRVRLELARSLYMLEEDDAAAYHFRLALAQAPSPEVAANIERFLTSIESRRVHAFSFAMAVAPDTNVNSGTTADSVNLFGFLPADLSRDAQETSGVGLKTSLSAAWLPHLSADWRGVFRVAALATDYSGDKFDDVGVNVEAGVKRLWGRAYVSVAATLEQRWVGGAEFFSAPGVVLSGAVRNGRWISWAALDGAHYDYATETARTGPVASATGGVSHALDSLSSANVQIGYSREFAEADFRRSAAYSLSIGYAREFANALTVNISPSVSYRRFDERDPLFGVTRMDFRYGATAGVLNRRWSFRGFSPSITYTFTRNESNTSVFDFTRHQLDFRLSRVF